MSFSIATTVAQALTAIADGARPIAGGSDLVVGARHGKAPLPDSLVAIDRVAELSEIEAGADGTRIGAVVNHARLMTDPIVVDNYTALADAAALVGSPATRSVGTLGGNIMNGSPAMDTGAPLIVMGAQVELQSAGGVRTLSIADLWDAPGSNTAAADELCTAVLLPPPGERCGSAYVRLEYRRAMEIAVVGAAAAVVLDDAGAIVNARVALAAVAPTIIEVGGIEDRVAGRPLDDDGRAAVAEAASAQASPISDMRASDAYRRHTVGVMARRAVDAAVRRALGEEIAVPVNRALGIGAA
jgi:CO/xanthine dehydrogenase FAD-binding subunit